MNPQSTQINSGLVRLLTLIVFISQVSLGIGCTYMIARSGFGINLSLTAKTVSFFLLLINGPILPSTLRRNGQSSFSQTGYYTSGVILLIGFTGLSGMLIRPPAGLFSTGTAIAFLGAVAFLVNLIRLKRTTSLMSVLILTGLSVCFTLWLSGRLWGPNILHPLYFETLATGRGFIDTLFHISISQMIHTYGTVSTGVDGLAIMHYHAASHWLVAQWVSLLGVPVFDFFVLAYSTIVLPFFYFSILLLSIRLSELFGQPFSLDIREPAGRAFWFLFFMLTIRILPDRALVNLAVWETFDFSPSYFLGLSFMFLFIAIVLDLWNRPNGWVSILLLWIAIPLAIAILGLMKNSVMMIAMAGYGFALLRQGRLRRPAGWIGLCLAAFAAAWTLISVTNFGVGNSGMRFFAFLRSYVPLHLLPYHLIVYFGFLVFYAMIRVRQVQMISWESLKQAFRNHKILDLEILLLIAAFGVLPGLFMMIPNGSAHYFSDISVRLAVPLILAQSGWITQHLYSMRLIGRRILIPFILFILGWKTASLDGFYIKGNLVLRREIRSDLSESSLIKKRNSFLIRLRELDQLPLAEKKRTLIHVAKSDSVFWNHFLGHESPQNLSLLVPAVTGIAMLDGLPPDTIKTAYYGFGGYKKRERHPEGKKELCRAAFDIGFQNAEIVSFSRFYQATDIIRCPIKTEATE